MHHSLLFDAPDPHVHDSVTMSRIIARAVAPPNPGYLPTLIISHLFLSYFKGDSRCVMQVNRQLSSNSIVSQATL